MCYVTPNINTLSYPIFVCFKALSLFLFLILSHLTLSAPTLTLRLCTISIAHTHALEVRERQRAECALLGDHICKAVRLCATCAYHAKGIAIELRSGLLAATSVAVMIGQSEHVIVCFRSDLLISSN